MTPYFPLKSFLFAFFLVNFSSFLTEIVLLLVNIRNDWEAFSLVFLLKN